MLEYYDDPLVDLTHDPDNGIEVDFAYIHRVRQHGDISVLFTWNFAKDNGDPDPMIALAPTYKPPHQQAPRLACIPMSDGWKWSRTHNNDAQVVFELGDRVRISGDQWQREMAAYFASVLGLNAENPGTIRRVRGIIEDSLHDLAVMPPAPQRDALFEDHGMEVEIIDHSTGATHSAPLREQ